MECAARSTYNMQPPWLSMKWLAAYHRKVTLLEKARLFRRSDKPNSTLRTLYTPPSK